jgi:hypothetical protein
VAIDALVVVPDDQNWTGGMAIHASRARQPDASARYGDWLVVKPKNLQILSVPPSNPLGKTRATL